MSSPSQSRINVLSDKDNTMASTTGSTTTLPDREALKLNMLRRIRPAPLKYAWAFYHDKNSTSGDYEGRLTVMLENIITIKPFWEMLNQFPFENLRLRDSVHFFKRGVKPVWEDVRNINGGSWTFRIPKAQSHEFWKETLLLVVGEQFADVIEPRKASLPSPWLSHYPLLSQSTIFLPPVSHPLLTKTHTQKIRRRRPLRCISLRTLQLGPDLNLDARRHQSKNHRRYPWRHVSQTKPASVSQG